MAMYRAELQRLARLRLREARTLLRAGLYAGAYHVAGYSVECALKASIARNVAQYEFPDKRLADKAWVHEPEKLVNIAGLGLELQLARQNATFDARWAIVTKWNPDSRYTLSISKTAAIGLYSAIAARKNGILQWIRIHW
jgi:hypothetical protein